MPSRKPESPSTLSRVRDLLRRPLKLEVRGAQVQVMLGGSQERQGAGAGGTSAGEALRCGHAELRRLLRLHPETRQLMRHLGFVEQTIGRFGSRAIQREIPVPVMRRAIDQLDLLADGAPSEGLAHLRARLLEAVQIRSAAVAIDEETETRPGSLEVSEASHSLFDEMERSWTGQIPVGIPPAASRG